MAGTDSVAEIGLVEAGLAETDLGITELVGIGSDPGLGN